jgi:hypothetical protein
MVDSYMFAWENQVNSNLHSTRQQYKAAMSVEYESDTVAIIKLQPTENSLPMMLEEGASQFDIKEGMAKSDKRTIKEGGGWYITIPFRHATTEALGESSIFSGRPKDSYGEKGKNLPKEVYLLAKNTKEALTPDDLPEKYRALLSNPTTGYEHKSPIYEGLKRYKISSTDKENRGGYMTFRRISDQSDEDSWVHKGFKPMRLMNLALQDANLDIVVSNAIDSFLENI